MENQKKPIAYDSTSGTGGDMPDADCLPFIDDSHLWSSMLAGFSESFDDQPKIDGTSTSKCGYGDGGVHSYSGQCWSVPSVDQSLNSAPGSVAGVADHCREQTEVEFPPNPLQALHSEEMANSITPLSGCDIESLSSESDEEEVQSDSTVNAKGKDHVNSQIPETGMEFPSEEAAYNFYKSYAKEIGFNVRKGKVQRLSNGSIRKRYLFCTRQGFRQKKQSTETARYQRRETRTGCKAMVQFTIEHGKWVISHFIPDHNHDLEGKSELLIFGNSVDHPLDTTVNKASLVEEASLTNYEGYHTGECTNFPPDADVNCSRVDGQSLINFFRDLQMTDPLFLYILQVNANNFLKNFFWRDGRSKMDYDCFGDVLILDTTPKIGPHNMFCVSFLGINHHGRFFLFGGALLLDNSVESFIWLLRAFLDAMGRRQPKTIFTHGGQAIAKAIEVALPESQHLLGVWHIIRNLRKYLSDYFNHPGFESCFNKCIFDCESEEEFEFKWETLLKQYDLHENSWLKTIYKVGKTCSRFSSGGIFSAGIRSIEGCKGIDFVIQKLMRGTMAPLQFVQQFLKLVEQQRQQELNEDACCSEGAPATILRNNLIEKEAANMYTRAIFKLFREELLGCLSVGVEEISSNGMITKFKLTEEGCKEKIVEFNCLDSTVTCNCRKYESVGILCVHALKVLNTKNIFHIPPQYILKRWTKSAKDGMVEDNQGGVTGDSPRHFQMWRNKLTHKALYLIAKSSAAMDTCAITDGFLNKALESVEDVSRVKSNNNACHANEVVGMDIQKQLSDSGGNNQQEESDVRPKSQLKRKCDNKVTMGAEHQRLRKGVSYSSSVGENLQKSTSSRPPPPSKSTFQFRGPSKSTGNMQGLRSRIDKTRGYKVVSTPNAQRCHTTNCNELGK